MTESKLTHKEQKFVDLVARGIGYEEAAKQSGYSERSAATLASRLLKKVEVSSEIKKRQEYYRTLADVTDKEIIGAHVEMAFASIEDALNDTGYLDFAKAKENGSAKLIKKISRVNTKYGENVAVEFYARTDALGQLTDILGLKQLPQENTKTILAALNAYNLWLEKNTNEELNIKPSLNDKLDAIKAFAAGTGVDEATLKRETGVEEIATVQ